MPTRGRFEDQARGGSSGIPASPSERQKMASAVGPRRSGWSPGVPPLPSGSMSPGRAVQMLQVSELATLRPPTRARRRYAWGT